jgi:hypothetical protein
MRSLADLLRDSELRRAHKKLRRQSEAQRDQNKHPETGEKACGRRRRAVVRFIKNSAIEFGALGSDPIARENAHATTPQVFLCSPYALAAQAIDMKFTFSA